MSAAVAEPRVGSGAPVSASLNLVDDDSPWLGLDSFSEETRGYFHGREEEIAELARRVQRKLLAILFGQSGLGKTSILRAGIVPRLRREGFCPVYVRIDYAPESPPPSEQIKQAIFRATESHGKWTRPGTAIPGESLWEFLHHRDDILRDAEGRTLTPLLIFDQFEEIFTLGQDDDFGRKRAAEFIRDLADLVENRPPKSLEVMLDLEEAIVERFDFSRADYRILIALREDYLAHLEGLKGEMPSITQNRMRLARMTGEQALSAVTKPGGRLVTQEVAEAIVRFVAGGAELRNAEVEPSLLSLVCRELNNARKSQGRAEISADLLAGSRDTILNEFYERTLADQPAGVRKFIEDEMLTESGFRESLAEERVIKGFVAAGAPQGSLAALVNRRLLRIEERLDVRRVELTHDVLCAVVKASRDQRHEREARDEAERQLKAQREREEATHKALVRARKVAAGCAVLAGVAILSAIFGYVSMQRAKEAEGAALATRQQAEGARGEAEKLVAYLLEDFHLELEPIGRLDVVADLSRRALKYYEGLPAALRSTDTERNRALAQVRLGAALRTLARTEEAEKAIGDAISTLGPLHAKGDRSETTAIGLGLAFTTRGRLLGDRLRFEDAEKAAVESERVLAPAAQDANASVAVRRAYGQVNNFLGFLQQRVGKDEAAIKTLAASREAYRSIDGLKLTDLASAAAYVEATSWLMDALENVDRREESRRLGEEALEVANKVLEKQPGHMMALRARGLLGSNLGGLASFDLRVKAALPLLEAAARDWEAFVKVDPGNTIAWNNLGSSVIQLAFSLEALGRPVESSRRFREVLERSRPLKMTPMLARNFTFPWGHVARIEGELGNVEGSRRALAEGLRYNALVLEDQTISPGARGMGEAYRPYWEAILALGAGEFASARESALVAVQRYEKIQPGNEALKRFRDKQLADSHYFIAIASNELRDYAAAASHARKALAVMNTLPPRSPFEAFVRQEFHLPLAIALARQDKLAEARAVLEPVRRYFSQPGAGGDAMYPRVVHAAMLFAEALATPSESTRLLAEAGRLIESVPDELRRARTVNRLREQVAREAATRR